MPPLDFKTLKTWLRPVLRLIFAIALAWLWVLLCATPAYAQDGTLFRKAILTSTSFVEANITSADLMDVIVSRYSLLSLCDRTSEKNP